MYLNPAILTVQGLRKTSPALAPAGTVTACFFGHNRNQPARARIAIARKMKSIVLVFVYILQDKNIR
jgi:hypothetical protein